MNRRRERGSSASTIIGPQPQAIVRDVTIGHVRDSQFSDDFQMNGLQLSIDAFYLGNVRVETRDSHLDQV